MTMGSYISSHYDRRQGRYDPKRISAIVSSYDILADLHTSKLEKLMPCNTILASWDDDPMTV